MNHTNESLQVSSSLGQRDPIELSPSLSQHITDFWQRTLKRCLNFLEQLKSLPRNTRRRIQRASGLTLAGVALSLALSNAPTVEAATITVGGGCTLVDAISSANSDSPVGSCASGSGADTVVLAGGTYSLTTVNNTAGDGYGNGLPLITTEITIEGNGSTIQRTGATEFRLFEVASGGNLTLDQVTIQGGQISSSATDAPEIHGGGVLVTSGGTLTVRDSTITGNTVINTSLTGSSGSYRYASGGGISAFGGTATVENSTITNNEARAYSSYGVGGGISARGGGSMTAINSTITGNLSNNGTSGSGGGLSAGGGGGVFVGMDGSSLSLTHCTITGNEARTFNGTNENGGGVYAYAYGGATITTSIVNTIITANTGDNDCNATNNTPTTTSSLITVSNACGGTVPTALNLGSLANNGGPTETIALLAGSTSAIDQIPIAVGVCEAILSADQRGFARANGTGEGGTACDIGAFEYASFGPPTAITIQGLSAEQQNTGGIAAVAGASLLTLGTAWAMLKKRFTD